MGARVAVAGATGAVGREMVKVLEARSFPMDSLRLFASKASAGKRIPFQGSEVKVEALEPGSFEGVDLVFSSLKSGLTRTFVPEAVKRGAVVVDNSSAYRMDDGVPLVVPEVNANRAREHQGIVANPNCSTIQMVVALAPLHREAGIRRVVVTTYQAASGAGQKAMEELREQTRAVLDGAAPKPEAFQHPIAFNVIPHIAEFEEGGYTFEEMKMLRETRKILEAPALEVSATCVRIPVLRAHSEAVHLELEKKISASEAREIFASAPGVKVLDDPSSALYPMPLDATGRDEVFVGRIREDLALDNGLAFWVVADQLLKGAALNAVQIAEALL